MNNVLICLSSLLIAMLPFRLAAGDEVPVASTSAPATLPSADAGTDLVVHFYRALLQEEPPTREQELTLFSSVSGLRWQLVVGKGEPQDAHDVEPMNRTADERERRRRQEAKVVGAGPVVLTYFRQHKDWFLPKNMKSPADVQVSSTYHFVRNLDYPKEPPKLGYGSVLALFSDDKDAAPGTQRLRAVVFKLVAGKIDPGAIRLDAYQGKTTEELYDAEANAPRP